MAASVRERKGEVAARKPPTRCRLDLGVRIDLDGTVPFRRTSDVLLPMCGGVYLIHDLRGVLYVGRTCDLLRRFQEHEANPANPLILKARSCCVGPIMFSWVVLADHRRRRAVEAELVAALDPPCNRCLPGGGPVPTTN